MRERGLSFRQISRKMVAAGVTLHPNTLSYICLVQGADSPKAMAKWKGPKLMAPIAMRNGAPVRAFTAEEDAQLRQWDAEGLSYSQMAHRLGRARNSVVGRMATLARHDARAEAAA